MQILKSFVGIIVLASSMCAFADDGADARTHFQRATAHYAVGEFAEAAVEYQAAYMLKQDPALLFDAAQAYRLAGDHKRALILYRNYLQMFPNEPNASLVRTQIEQLKSVIAADEKAKTSPPTGTVEPKPPVVDGPPATKEAAAAAPTATPTETSQAVRTTTTATADHHTPLYKKWWLWTVVGVVAAGGAVTAALLVTQSQSHWSNTADFGPGVSSAALVRW